MFTIKRRTYFFILFLCWCIRAIYGNSTITEDTNAVLNENRIDNFMRHFVVLFWHSFYNTINNPAWQNGRNSNYVNHHFNIRQEKFPLFRTSVYGLSKSAEDAIKSYKFSLQPGPLYAPPRYPSSLQRPFPLPAPNGYPPPTNYLSHPYSPYPPGYRPSYNSCYPFTSIFCALDSISKYDDLRCVPRLLCEVTTGSRAKSDRPSYPPENINDNGSPIPFLSKDALTTLLTVLNFVDDSPLLLFARAAFLGYSSKGNIQACLTAYPTCPRNPDQLIDYLNNHNGGFFRFFNQQLQHQPQYAPQYQQFIQKYQQQHGDNPLNDPMESALPTPRTEAITPQYNDAVDKQNPISRILNDPIDIEYINHKIHDIPLRQQHQRKIVFQNADYVQSQYQNIQDYKLVSLRGGKKFAFPEQTDEIPSHSMIFPDKTGTGNLILSSDINGNYKILYTSDEFSNRTRMSKRIRFQADGQRSKRRIKFPREIEA